MRTSTIHYWRQIEWRRIGACSIALGFLFGIGAPAGFAQDDARAQASQYNKMGSAALHAGQLDRALEAYQRALDGFQSAEDKRGMASALTNIGLVYARLGQSRKALEFYERALTLADPADSANYSILLGNLGGVTLRLGDAKAAVRFFTRSLEIEEKRGDRTAYALTLDGLGQAHSILREFDKALDYQKQALAVIEPTGNLGDAARILNNMGGTAKMKGDYDLAIRCFSDAINLKRQFAPSNELASSLTNIALVYFDRQKLPEAAAFVEAIILDEQASREVRDASKLGEFQDWFRSSLYRRYAHVLIQQNKPEDALVALERGRNQGLGRQAAQNRADFSHVLRPNDARRLAAAQAQYNAASDEMRKTAGLEFLADGAGDSESTRLIRSVRSNFDLAERNLSALRAELASKNSRYRRLCAATPTTINELKDLAAKNPDTLYLQWAVGAEKTSLLFALSKSDGVQAFVIDSGEEALTKQVAILRAAIEKESAPPEIAASKALYSALFSPIEKAGLLAPNKFKRLVMVGDGPLLELPYAVLLDNADHRLIERYPIAVSASFGLLTWPDEREKPTAPLFVAADPVTPDADKLPSARQEGLDIAELFPGASVLVGAEVTKPAVVKNLSTFGILHFATHGVIDDEDGLGCGLLLATPKGEEELSVLEARDLLSMSLSAQMAVLSACETGRGVKSGGEGLLGLVWAFRAAGCPSTVASLWSVEDTSTSALMVLFYQGLKAGKRKDDALREAMLAVQAESPAPLYWAAFQINGSAEKLML